MSLLIAFLKLLSLVLALPLCTADPESRRLYDTLFRQRVYNKLVRPVSNSSNVLTVWIDLQLSLLIDVDEKSQIMATNVWLRHIWKNDKLQWNPQDYGGIRYLYVPSIDLWLPDIVLYNNADGKYEIVLLTKATVRYDGMIDWNPPAIYKSSCAIDIEHFPFDTQVCTMKFGSWTYDLSMLDLQHVIHYGREDDGHFSRDLAFGVNIEQFTESVEWDLLSAFGNRTVKKYPCCPQLYVDITFHITLRRKVIFYLVNLICPCVAISFLTVLVFFLPADSGEKVALCINILLSLTVFFLLLAEIIPPTSLVIPLIGKYLLLTIGLLTLSIIVTIINLNLHYRSSVTSKRMPPWMRRVFLEILPRLLVLQKPNFEYNLPRSEGFSNFSPPESPKRDGIILCFENYPKTIMPAYACTCGHDNFIGSNEESLEEDSDDELDSLQVRLFKALGGLRAVAANTWKQDDRRITTQEWNYAAMVIDRLCLYIFTTACVLGTAGIIMQAPSLYSRPVMNVENYRQCSQCVL